MHTTNQTLFSNSDHSRITTSDEAICNPAITKHQNVHVFMGSSPKLEQRCPLVNEGVTNSVL